jgi:small subunit ribosomal protein S6e|tara:strand:- start:568 stop:1083 length:516 start_codon:yes stop_codon:yes gene_type:complete
MVNFKLCIGDPKTGKTYQTEAKDQSAQGFIGKNLGESVKGDLFELPGYEFIISGGSDFCGFPMRKGILGVRKKINLLGGVGFKAKKTEKGVKKRKTVCGHKITENIIQINLKVTKEGSKKLVDMFGKKEEGKEAPKEEKKAEDKLKEEKKEAKPKQEKPKQAQEKKEEKKQ